MHGMRHLTEMRRSGFRPAAAFVDVDAADKLLPTWLQWHASQVSPAELDVPTAESLSRIDWRPLVGMLVYVNGENAERVLAAAHAIIEVGAKRVIYACFEKIGDDEFIAYRQVWCYDTDGLCSPKEPS